MTLTYRFAGDDYHFSVDGRIDGLGGTGGVLLVDLGQGLRSVEAEAMPDYREYAVVTKATKTQKQRFASTRPGERVVLERPVRVGRREIEVLPVGGAGAGAESARPFGGAITVGQPRDPVPIAQGCSGPGRRSRPARRWRRRSRCPRRAISASRSTSVPSSTAVWSRSGTTSTMPTRMAGRSSGPSSSPFPVVVVHILFWMHERLLLAYGWVLMIFGILIRMLLWPLQQRAMESSMRMQAVAPLIKEIQARYKADPEKLQTRDAAVVQGASGQPVRRLSADAARRCRCCSRSSSCSRIRSSSVASPSCGCPISRARSAVLIIPVMMGRLDVCGSPRSGKWACRRTRRPR